MNLYSFKTLMPGKKQILFFVPFIFIFGAIAQTTSTWTTPGTYSFTVPSGVTKIKVKVWGAGGGGGGSSSQSKSGGGGGGGAYTTQTFNGLTPGTPYSNSIIVGTGGNGGAAGNNPGTAGGNSSATLSSTVTANGGGFGGGGSAGGVGTAGAGGAAGTYKGGNGSAGMSGGAGGGGSAGTGSDGNGYAPGVTGTTGQTAVTGGGAGGNGTNGGAGLPGGAPGGGGGGGDKSGGTNGSGGAGGAGQVILEYYPEFTISANVQTPGNICAGLTTKVIHSFALTGLNNGGTVTDFSFVTTGDYTAAEISNFKLYYTTTNSFATTNLLATIASPASAGSQTFPSFSQSVGNTTYYFWITMDVAASVTNNHTLAVSATSTSNVTSSTSGIILSGSATASNTATLIAAPSAPTGTATQNFCSGDSHTVADLSATGTSILWYSASSGGSSLATSTTLTDATHYYASQTVSGCESTSRLDVTVTVSASTTASAGDAISAIYQGETTSALGGSMGGGATSGIWDDGGAGGSFSNNDGTTPNTATYTASATSPASVTLTLTATGSCGTATASKVLTVNTAVATPIFALGATSNRCHSAGPVTYSATATNSTSIAYSLDATSVAAGNTINTTTGEVTYTEGWTGASVITATASGPNGPKTATHTATTNAAVSSPSFISVH